jgi:acyl-CoA dehydrogenase
MRTEDAALADALESILGDHCPPAVVDHAEESGWAPRLWDVLAQGGYPWIGIPEEGGGSGGGLAEACTMLFVAGRYATPLPLVETGVMAGWALARAGLRVPKGPVTVAVETSGLSVARDGQGGLRLSGRLDRVPWARRAERVVIVVDLSGTNVVIVIDPDQATVVPGVNLAGEPRDTMKLDSVRVDAEDFAPGPVTPDQMLGRGALGRAALMAGAMDRVRQLTIRYTQDREQFGRPIARFQAVATHMVRIVEEATVAAMAVRSAAATIGPDVSSLEIGSAKIVAGQACSVVTAAAHQAHGAIGMTKEYELGRLSRRLWSWRDEYGSEEYWGTRIGRELAEAGAEQLWGALAVGEAGADSVARRLGAQR